MYTASVILRAAGALFIVWWLAKSVREAKQGRPYSDAEFWHM